MHRLNHPVYRNRVLQVAADALLVALAFFLAFRLRFLDDPQRHAAPLLDAASPQSVGFVVVGKVVVFAAFGLYQKWWRYVSGRDFLADPPRRRRLQRDPRRRLHRRCSRSTTTCRARSR